MYVIGVGLAFLKLKLMLTILPAVSPHGSFRRVSVCRFCGFNRDINGICSIASWEGVCCEIDLIQMPDLHIFYSRGCPRRPWCSTGCAYYPQDR